MSKLDNIFRKRSTHFRSGPEALSSRYSQAKSTLGAHFPRGGPFQDPVPMGVGLTCRMVFDRSVEHPPRVYGGTSLIRQRLPLGPYSRHIPRVLWGSKRGGLCLMSEVPLYPFREWARPVGGYLMGPSSTPPCVISRTIASSMSYHFAFV